MRRLGTQGTAVCSRPTPLGSIFDLPRAQFDQFTGIFFPETGLGAIGLPFSSLA